MQHRASPGEYQRIVRDLASIGDTATVSATKEGIKFSTTGDIGTANVTLRQTSSADKEEDNVTIDLKEPVALTFALRYLNNFAKATPLSSSVQVRPPPASLQGSFLPVWRKCRPLANVPYCLKPADACPQVSLTRDLPVKVSYNIGDIGGIQYYLAPKIEDDETAAGDE